MTICINGDGDICVDEDGNICNEQNACNSCDPPLPDSLTAVLSGFTGDFAFANGSWDMPLIADCTWSSDQFADPPTLIIIVSWSGGTQWIAQIEFVFALGDYATITNYPYSMDGCAYELTINDVPALSAYYSCSSVERCDDLATQSGGTVTVE